MLPFKARKNDIHKIQTDFPLSPKLLSGYQANWSKNRDILVNQRYGFRASLMALHNSNMKGHN